VKPEVQFRKLPKSHMPNSKSHDYKQQTLSSTTFIFSWAPGLNLLLAWFLDVNTQYSLLSATPKTIVLSLEIVPV